MRNVIFLGLILLLLGSCTPEEKIIYVQFDHSQGLQAQHDLILKGVTIGKITKVELTNDYKVLASVRLSDSIELPKDSKFIIGSRDLFTKALIVEEGTSKTYLIPGDTVHGRVSNGFLETFDFKDSNPLEGIDKLLEN